LGQKIDALSIRFEDVLIPESLGLWSKPMNTKRVWIGGITAGVVMLIINFAAVGSILTKRYMALTPVYYYKEPVLPFLPGWVLMFLATGVGLAWLYAAVRPRLGPGPKTALMIGVVVGLMIYVPSNFAEASWNTSGRFIPLVQMITGIFAILVGSLVAGALYKE
jgi:hypothetical protein